MTINVVLCTAPNEESATRIAHELIRAEYAACVNILPNITSVYKWEGQVEQDREVQLIIKTSAHAITHAYELVCGLHPYDVPEWVVLDAAASDDYRTWVHDVTKTTKEHS
ncbi:divalent-cation tolerance protein CutA [Alteromonas sp. A079]|uniref:divalent-cation tolerance protein CutA n=1 Tax=Alteromonas sp. A079 TaxID=3410268 RepID=UPI003BA30357